MTEIRNKNNVRKNRFKVVLSAMNNHLDIIKRYLLIILFISSIAIPANAKTYFISQVIDGDTVLLKNNEIVRLLGIDAPEIGQPGYDLAKWFLFYITEGEEIILEKDFQDQDEYGRLLRYVFLNKNSQMINELMLRYGLADFRYLSLDAKYYQRLNEATLRAEKNKHGLWAFSVFSPSQIKGEDYSVKVINWQEAPTYINQMVTLEGFILRTHDSGKACFLNFQRNWQGTINLVIFAEHYHLYPANPAVYFLNKKIKVTGLIQLHNGNPQMIIKSPQQISIIDIINK